MIDREELLKQKEYYKEGEKLNMCKAMEDWKEELLQQCFKEKKNVVKYEKMYRRKVGIKWN